MLSLYQYRDVTNYLITESGAAIYGGHAGAIIYDQTSLTFVRKKLLEGYSVTDGEAQTLADYIALALLDVSIPIFDDEFYKSLDQILKIELRQNRTEYDNYKYYLQRQQIFHVTQLENERGMQWVNSLRNCAPSIKMRTEVLRDVVSEFIDKYAASWKEGEESQPTRETETSVTAFLEAQPFYRKRISESRDLLIHTFKQIEKVFRFARDYSDFDNCKSLMEFQTAYELVHDHLPRELDLLNAQSFWQVLRAKLGAVTDRVSQRRLRQLVRDGTVTDAPDGSPVNTERFNGWEDEQIPCGKYTQTDGRQVLVCSKESRRKFTITVCEALLVLNLDKDRHAAWLEIEGTIWVVASYQFYIRHLPKDTHSALLCGAVNGQAVCRYFCTGPSNAIAYDLYNSEHRRTKLEGPRYQAVESNKRKVSPYWTVAFDGNHYQPRLKLALQNYPEDSWVRLFFKDDPLCEHYVENDPDWTSGLSVPPVGEVAVISQDEKDRAPFQFGQFKMFGPGYVAGNWQELRGSIRYADGQWLVVAAVEQLKVSASPQTMMEVSGPYELAENGWSGYRAWLVKRNGQPDEISVKIGPQEFVAWKSAILRLSVKGAVTETPDGCFFCDDPANTVLVVRGYVGKSCAFEKPKLLVIDGARQSTCEIGLQEDKCDVEIRLAELLDNLPTERHLTREVLCRLEVPSESDVKILPDEGIRLCKLPRLQALDEPRVLPGDAQFTIRIPVEATEQDRIETYDLTTHSWELVQIENGMLNLVIPVTREIISAKRGGARLKINGCDVPVTTPIQLFGFLMSFGR